MRIISIYSSLHFNQYCLSYMSCFLYSLISFLYFFFFFNDPPTPEIYPLSLHDALPILVHARQRAVQRDGHRVVLSVVTGIQAADESHVRGCDPVGGVLSQDLSGHLGKDAFDLVEGDLEIGRAHV